MTLSKLPDGTLLNLHKVTMVQIIGTLVTVRIDLYTHYMRDFATLGEAEKFVELLYDLSNKKPPAVTPGATLGNEE